MFICINHYQTILLVNMNIEIDPYFVELNSRMNKYREIRCKADIIHKNIENHTYNMILTGEISMDCINYDSVTNIEINYYSQVTEHQKAKVEVLKKIRSVFLYFNRVKKNIFSFCKKRRSLWKTNLATVLRLKEQLDKEAEIYPENEHIKRALVLLKSTLNKYRSDYGITIGLVLNRLFCRDISWTIREYI